MDNAFFSRFPGFRPDPSLSAFNEFSRLAHHMNWTTGSKRYRKEWTNFASTEFAHYFDVGNKLQSYRALCHELKIEGSLASITQCRNVSSNPLLALIRLNEIGPFQGTRQFS
jgi:hypothetical protein